MHVHRHVPRLEDVGERAESRVDAVDHLAPCDALLDETPRHLNSGSGSFGESDPGAVCDGRHLFERQRFAIQRDQGSI